MYGSRVARDIHHGVRPTSTRPKLVEAIPDGPAR
jgi:hypothetical protein